MTCGGQLVVDSCSVATAWLAGLVASQPRLQVASKHNFAQAIATLVAS